MPECFTFLTTFDHLSVIERKNPTMVIDAFRQAFPERDDVALVVKSMNGHLKPASARLVNDTVGGDERVVVIDEHVDAADHAAMVDHADCLVSLHRSEGLGLHLAEAMWLGTPVLATGYSGNLDLMDDACAALVDAGLTQVLNGEGAYPEGELWGQPNILQAIDAMRRIESDEHYRTRLTTAARERMSAQDDPVAVGRRMLAAIEASAAAPSHGGARLAAVASGAKRIARRSTSPLRHYVNTHFEQTKQEVRDQVAALEARSELTRLADTIESFANTIAELQVHETRTLTDLRSEVAELRHDLNELTAAVVRLSEGNAETTAPPETP
jgi:hypothetical protein